jgi:hypothetical protein
VATINWNLFTGASSANHRQEQADMIAADKRRQAQQRQAKPRTYHTLVIREEATAPWEIHFGDYDLFVVRQERADWVAGCPCCPTLKRRTHRHTAIVHSGDSQAEIDAAVALLNAASTTIVP